MQKSTVANPPPPPPPAPPKTKSNRKMLIALGVIVIIVVAVVVGVLLVTRGGSSGGDIAGASSLTFNADVTYGSGTVTTYTYNVKNIGTSDMMLRLEWTSSGVSYIYIINGKQQQAWTCINGDWTDLSASFSETWSDWNSTFAGYTSNLAHWSGSGDYKYTNPDGSIVRIYNVVINPSLSDSLFEHS